MISFMRDPGGMPPAVLPDGATPTVQPDGANLGRCYLDGATVNGATSYMMR